MADYTPIIKKLVADARISAVYLHGSVAKGTARADSDLDVAVLVKAGEKISSLEFYHLAGELSQYSDREVHLGQLNFDNLVYTKQVLEHGELLYCRAEFENDMFVCTALSMYVKFVNDAKEVYDVYKIG